MRPIIRNPACPATIAGIVSLVLIALFLSPPSTSSPSTEFTVEAPVATLGVTSKVAACLRDAPFSFRVKTPRLYGAALKAHFEEILEYTDALRGYQPHYSAQSLYGGPWLEDTWISTFCCNSSDFGGTVPLFVQWQELHVRSIHSVLYARVLRDLQAVLRDDVLYVTVSQSDWGITERTQIKFPNVLVFSGGGYGHVAIPLMSKEMEAVVPTERKSFMGFMEPEKVKSVLGLTLQKEADHAGFPAQILPFGSKQKFVELARETVMNLAPRGSSRASRRTAELIGMDIPPVYVFNDLAWVPYPNTSASLSEVGWVVDAFKAGEWIRGFVQMHAQNKLIPMYENKRDVLRRHRASHYTYAGIMEQIRLFLTGDESDLRCQRHPEVP